MAAPRGVGFTQKAARRVIRGIRTVEGLHHSQFVPPPRNRRHPRRKATGGSIVIALPTGGIPARSGNTPGMANCVVYRLTGGSLAAVSPSRTEDIYNLSPTVLKGDYTIANQDDYGDYYANLGGLRYETDTLAPELLWDSTNGRICSDVEKIGVIGAPEEQDDDCVDFYDCDTLPGA